MTPVSSLTAHSRRCSYGSPRDNEAQGSMSRWWGTAQGNPAPTDCVWTTMVWVSSGKPLRFPSDSLAPLPRREVIFILNLILHNFQAALCLYIGQQILHTGRCPNVSCTFSERHRSAPPQAEWTEKTKSYPSQAVHYCSRSSGGSPRGKTQGRAFRTLANRSPFLRNQDLLLSIHPARRITWGRPRKKIIRSGHGHNIHLFLNSPTITASHQTSYCFAVTCRMQSNDDRKYQKSGLQRACPHEVNHEGHRWAKRSICYRSLAPLKMNTWLINR